MASDRDYLGCLENKDDVQRFDAKPYFRLVGTMGRNRILNDDYSISIDMETLYGYHLLSLERS
jgi:hypothetical protein